MPDAAALALWDRMDPPQDDGSTVDLGPRPAAELDVTSRMWFACGYRPGIGAYLNFFLLADFIETHDRAFPPRFHSLRSMADSFYRTDLFVRDVTDSGPRPTSGISSPAVRSTLREIMGRHRRIGIPPWMMSYFGFSLTENVEKQVQGFDARERQLHLDYMTRAYRIMGLRFSSDRGLMEEFGRSVERAHAGPSPHVEQHARNILVIGEMVGVRSHIDHVGRMLPGPTREQFQRIYRRVRPGLPRRLAARAVGRVVMKRAIGTPRKAVPLVASGGEHDAS